MTNVVPVVLDHLKQIVQKFFVGQILMEFAIMAEINVLILYLVVTAHIMLFHAQDMRLNQPQKKKDFYSDDLINIKVNNIYCNSFYVRFVS